MDPFNKTPQSPTTNPVVWPDSDEENNPDYYPQSQSLQQLLHYPQSPGHPERPTISSNKRRAEKWEWSPSSSPSPNRRRRDLIKAPMLQFQDISNYIKTKIDKAIEEGVDRIDLR